jgi:hypothetical protein
MNKFTSALCATLAFAMAASTAVPAVAAPVFSPNVPQASNDITQVQSRRDARRGDELRRGDRKRHDRGRFERRGNNAYYNNHRGYRERRPGYRQHNGFWFPPAAFIAGAIIGGALNNNNAVRSGGSAHVQWCHDRYRSYRSSDNTFQPYNGPRQQCFSPYS